MNAISVNPVPQPSKKTDRKEKPISFLLFSAVIVTHVVLALLMNKSSMIATVHAYGTILVGTLVAMSSKNLIKLAYAAGYITAAGVLWRMTGASILWEVSKYAVSLIFILGIFRKGAKSGGLVLLYFGLLLPSISQSLNFELVENMTLFRKTVSFNLSGPFALMVAAMFFTKFKINLIELENLFLIMLAPIVGIGAIAGFHTFTAEELYFATDSMTATSGGYGPNQVSSVLGYGAVLAFWYLMMTNRKPIMKMFLYGIGFMLATQCALTFSRGGLYCAVLGLCASALYLARNRKMGKNFIVTAVILILAGAFIAFPRLNTFTGGAITERFKETSLTGRETLFSQDLKLWAENPILGVGPGMSKFYRGSYSAHTGQPAHTEFSRLVAEHGTLGFLALICLFFVGVVRFSRCRNNVERGYVVCMVGWTVLYMITAAMRIALPSFVFGMAMAQIMTVSIPKKRL